MKRQIKVMPDFGDAIFWDKSGANIGGIDGCEGLNISLTLLKEFANWYKKFESSEFENNPDFNWDVFNNKGIELSRKLKKEIGENVEIIYEKPFEDPNHFINEQTLIT